MPIRASAVPFSQAIAEPDQVRQGEAARDHHADQKDLAQDVDVVLLAQVRRRQIFRVMEREHRHDGEPAQRQCDHAGDLALPDLERPALVKDGGRLANDRRWLHGRQV
jgi:hypothetical protein